MKEQLIKITDKTISINGIKFYHYSKAGKNLNPTQFIIYNGVTYYNTKL